MRYEKGHKETTRRRIVETAAARFRKDGIEGVGLADLMAEAGLTHGGFYSHFSSKEEIFERVLEDVQEELAARQMSVPPRSKDPADRIAAGALRYLLAACEAGTKQILLIDGPAVLGWVKWRELESLYGLGAIRAMLERAVEEGDLAVGQPVDALAHVLLAAADETALFIANAPDQHAARDQGVRALNAVLDGLRAT